MGWGRSGVGNSWLVSVLSSVVCSFYECTDGSYVDTRVIAFSSLADAGAYLESFAVGAPEVACRLPIYVINNCSEKERDLILSLLSANGVNVVAYFPPTELSAGAIELLSLRDVFYYPCSQLLEVVFLGCPFGTEDFWKIRAKVLRNVVEYYFDRGEGYRLNGLYSLVIKYDDDVLNGVDVPWSDYVMEMVLYIASVMGCDWGVSKIDNCFVTNARYVMRDGRSLMPSC